MGPDQDACPKQVNPDVSRTASAGAAGEPGDGCVCIAEGHRGGKGHSAVTPAENRNEVPGRRKRRRAEENPSGLRSDRKGKEEKEDQRARAPAAGEGGAGAPSSASAPPAAADHGPPRPPVGPVQPHPQTRLQASASELPASLGVSAALNTPQIQHRK